jgi:hypothetical protein
LKRIGFRIEITANGPLKESLNGSLKPILSANIFVHVKYG